MARGASHDLTDRLALTVKESAAVLGVGRDAVYNAINRGDLRAVRLGGSLLVPRAELERILGVEDPGTRAVPPHEFAGQNRRD